MAITEEELKNRSPEEIAKLQKENCVFCHIVNGKVSSKKIFEDNICLAILDINPANPGHILLLTKEHYQIMPQIPDEIISHIFTVAKKLSQNLLKSLKVQGTNIFIANGTIAGQRAPHFMVHIIPRKEGDRIKFTLGSKGISEEEQELIRKNIKTKVYSLLNLELKEPIELNSKPKKIDQKIIDAEYTENANQDNEKTDLDKISSIFSK